MLIYKNLMLAVNYIGINSALVLKYYYKGYLREDEKLQFLQTQVTSQEYLTQVSNFSPYLRRKITNFKSGALYTRLFEM